jgi:NAD(P)-dependent dehydrogenase (short-subunit alcohol dehydrogenase family)
MKVLITGASRGMGRETAIKFLNEGHQVIGLDISDPTITHNNYIHYIADVSNNDTLPDIKDVNILINNAGVENSTRDIEINLKGVMYCTIKYALNNPNIKAVVNQASSAASTGSDFGEYVASKGGVVAYTKWTAKEIAKYGATCNSISFGGVLTDLNWSVINDANSWKKIMKMTPMNKWATATEAADWIYFLSVVNKSCTAQDIVIDNGEMYNHQFIWT